MTEDDFAQKGCKQNLCRKYGISDEQLDFKYVEECKNPRTLEKILQILRSSEIGHFEKLELATEQRLREVAPNSRVLLTPQPVPSWNDLDAEQRYELARDYLDWPSHENDSSYQELRKEAEENRREVPAIRNTAKPAPLSKEAPVKKRGLTSSAPRSYEEWDNFNVDKELSLIDREDELKRIAAIRAQNEEKLQPKSSETLAVEEIGAGAAHRQNAATNQRMKGNEYFRENNISIAIEHYTTSISLLPNPESFNNRALCYIKQGKYQNALVDCKHAMLLSPNDPKVMSKALFHRSTALIAMDRSLEAYEEILSALKVDPNDKEVQKRAAILEKQCKQNYSSTKKVRMAIQDKEAGRSNPLIEEIATQDIYYPFTSSLDNILLSDIGTARTMCRCSGVPPFLAKLRSAESSLMNNRLYLRKIRPKKLYSDKKLPNRAEKVSGLVNGEIIEKDTVESVEKVVVNEEMRKLISLEADLFSSFVRRDLESIIEQMSTLHPSQVCEALSCTLSATTLNLFIKALCVYLQESSAWKRVEELLVAVAQLPRFRPSLKCLDKTTKDALSERIASIEEQGQRVSHVVTLYELNGALPPP